jgi:hypothetical protein
MIWSLNKYEIKKYLQDASFREYWNGELIDSKQKIHLILHNTVGYSFTQLQTSLDTSYIGLISISNYAVAHFPSCKSAQTLILHSLDRKLNRLGSYENLEILELRGISGLEAIGEMRD